LGAGLGEFLFRSTEMFCKLSSIARTSVIALAALGSLPAEAAPLGPAGQPAVADRSIEFIPVAQGEGRDCGPGYDCNFRHPRVRNGQNEDDGEWKGRERRRPDVSRDDDDDDNGWNDDRRRRRHYRDRYDDDFEFGLGLDYDEPIYRPRYKRVYRGGASGHVEWCHARYRSYRAWDNTWQPNYGRRRQCISPYS
jgi:hypothetical protein